MAGKISNTQDLIGSSWRILKNDKELLLFPLISGICLALVVASFLIPLLLDPALWHQLQQGHPSPHDKTASPISALEYAVLFLFYFCNYFVITFFNTGLIACAIRRMRGETATFKDGLWEATQRLHQIAGWSLIAASVGMALRIIENKSESMGKFIAGMLGTAFSIAQYFVIPIMVVENKNPFAALSESSSLFRKTWGEQLISTIALGVNLFLLSIPAVILVGYGLKIKSISCIIIGVLCLMLLFLAQSALQSIFQAALYLYSKDGNVPSGFDQTTMQSAFKAV